MLLRWITAVLVVAAVAGGFLAWRAGSDTTGAPEERAAREDGGNLDAASDPKGAGGAEGADGQRAGERGPEEMSCRAGEARGDKEIRIGSFERPENAPAYEILETERDSRDCARGAHLLVTTRSHDQAGYGLIARDIKARYAGLDAVSVEFTDATGVLDYEGAALIVNTPAGADYMGFVYGPPNNKGYFVQVAAD